ncbi:MAG: Bifunctional protein HldE [Chlamydiales bacterium]|nr:Bifunctional protein HldE [Chlamydiales bacterium]
MFEKKRVLVVGDVMLDVYTMGDVQRISPEAPVPVLRVSEESRRPGGAGNAILNLVSLGMEVVALGRVGADAAGSYFRDALEQEGVDTSALVEDPSFQTPVKNRMIASGQQIVRIDHERPSLLDSSLEKQICATFPTLLKSVDGVAISDYAKGFLTAALLSELITQARQLGVPVIVDPKGRDFFRYRGSSLLKPNFSEAVAAAGLGMEATLDDVARQILQEVAVETLMITRAKEGISIYSRHDCVRHDFPAQVHEIKDVTGAGDTVLAVVTAALVNQLPLAEAAHLANLAAGIAIERIGCARVSHNDLVLRQHQCAQA